MQLPHPISTPTRADLRDLIDLALPVVVVQLGLMMMGVVDTMMVGRVSAEALGAVALGNIFFFLVAVTGMGTLMALDPLVSQAVGAGDEEGVARAFQRGILLALGMSVPVMLGLGLVRPTLEILGQPPELIGPASRYIYFIIPGLTPFYLFIVGRQTLQSMGRIAPVVIVTVIANIVNVALNWSLIFGHLGSPPLGVSGAALATTLSRWFLAAALLVAGWKALVPQLRPWRRASLELGPLGRMLRLGLPIGGQMFLEYGIFGLVGVLMGRIGTLAVAGHLIALNLAAVVFMVPQGTGAAAAVLVGQAVGSADLTRARRAAAAAIFVGAGFMIVSAAAFLLAPEALARLYTPDRSVLDVAVTLVRLVGLFAIFDGLQAVAIGILRGIGDTRAPVAINVLGFWLIGLPISLLLAFPLGLGPPGLWWGLVIGLAVVAGVLLLRVRSRFRGEVRRLHIERPIPGSLAR
jgi:MATE family multidrug resistance protein